MNKHLEGHSNKNAKGEKRAEGVTDAESDVCGVKTDGRTAGVVSPPANRVDMDITNH